MAAERSENNGLSGNAAAQHGLSSAGRQRLLERVQVLYEKNFQRLPEGKAYLRRCGIVDPALWSRHRIGYCHGAMPALLLGVRVEVIETTVRNPLTGKLETQFHTVHGPTAVFQTTPRPDLHPETRSWFILTSIDESEDQTRAILRAQRQSHTLEDKQIEKYKNRLRQLRLRPQNKFTPIC